MARNEIEPSNSHGDGEHVDSWLARRLKAWHQVLGLSHEDPPIEPTNPYASILRGREKINPIEFAKNFRNATHFREIDADLVVAEDTVGFTRIVDGEEENYPDKMAQERKKGKNEAASYGIGTIGKRKFVEIVFNWDFMGASSGRVVGEKFLRAMKLAETKHLPVVALYCSGGQRQQEGASALREMLKTVYAVEQKFKDKTDLPIFSVLTGSTFGGITASGVPRGDVVPAMTGADFGFAGPDVIKSVEGEAPPPGSQTAENSFLTNRVVHMVLNNQKELLELLDKTFSMVNGNGQMSSKVRKVRETLGVDIDGRGYKTPFQSVKLSRRKRGRMRMYAEEVIPETVSDQHQVLRQDPRRPDTLYVLRHAFDGYVPYFTGRITEDKGDKHLDYPGIVAALAYIDDPRLSHRLRLMVVGDQTGYIKLEDGRIIKKHASPTAWDYRYQLKMLKYGQRLRYPAVSLIDTFGAKASIADELTAQYEAISDCLDAQIRYPHLTMGYSLGVLGSGGGLATAFTADYVAQLSGAQEFVAEPKSAAAILYKEPKDEDIVRTIEGMKPTADFALKLGLIDKVIAEPEGGAQNNPLAVALAVREDIIQTYLELGELTTEELMQRREQRIEGLNPIPIGYLETPTPRRGFPFRFLGR